MGAGERVPWDAYVRGGGGAIEVLEWARDNGCPEIFYTHTLSNTTHTPMPRVLLVDFGSRRNSRLKQLLTRRGHSVRVASPVTSADPAKYDRVVLAPSLHSSGRRNDMTRSFFLLPTLHTPIPPMAQRFGGNETTKHKHIHTSVR